MGLLCLSLQHARRHCDARRPQQSEAQARARYDAGLAGLVEVAEAQNLLAGAEYQNGLARVDVWRSLLARAVAQGNIAAFIELLRTSGVK